MKKIFLLALSVLLVGFSFSRNKTDDSFKKTKTPKQDTNYVNELNTLSRQLIGAGSFQSADSAAQIALSVGKNLNFKRAVALSLNMLGMIKQIQGDYGKAIDYLFTGLTIAEEIKDKTRIGRLFNAIATNYFYQKNNSKALEYYLKSLKVEAEINDKEGVARAYSNLSNVYKNIGDSARRKNNMELAKTKYYSVALDYSLKGLNLSEEIGEEKGIELNLGNIGSIYLEMYEYDKALEFFKKSLVISENHNDKGSIAIKLFNIGTLIAEKADSLKTLSAKKAECQKAKIYLERSLKLSEEAGDKQGRMLCYQALSKLSATLNDNREALAQFKNYITLRDSLFNEQNTKKTVQMEMTYEFDKKQAAAKLDQEKKEAVAEAESKKQKIIIISICGILLLVIAFAIFAYRSFLQKQKINLEILHQKQIIEEKQKEIIDSIYYAKRIQTALLPSEKYIVKELKKKS